MLAGIDYDQGAVTLAPGETLVLYTDGVTEAMNSENEEFGNDRLLHIFSSGAPRNSEEACQTVFKTVRDFVADTPQSDDITCLTICRGEFGS